MTITIRAAKLEELDTLLVFEQGIVEAERPFDPTLKPGVIHYYDLAELIRSTDAEVLVACSGEELVGSGYVTIKAAKPYRTPSRYAYIGFMYVKPDFRGRGVSKLLIDALISWAGAQNLTEIRLDVYEDNLAAVRAYEKVGFKKHLVEMRMSTNVNAPVLPFHSKK